MSKAGRSRHCKGREGGAIDKVGKCKKRLYDYYTEKAGIRFRSFGFFGIYEMSLRFLCALSRKSVLSIAQDGDGTVDRVGKG